MSGALRILGHSVVPRAARDDFVPDADGWIAGARRVPSPNFDARPEGVAIDLLVVHAISLPPEQFGGPGIVQLFTNTLDPDEHPYYQGICALRVSSHLLIRRDGEVLQFVASGARAWHAGVSSFAGRSRCNDFSLGIELEGSDEQAFEAVQYRVLAELVASLARRHPLADVVGHSEVAPAARPTPDLTLTGTDFAVRSLLAADRPESEHFSTLIRSRTRLSCVCPRPRHRLRGRAMKCFSVWRSARAGRQTSRWRMSFQDEA